jgi:hypothetical protein
LSTRFFLGQYTDPVFRLLGSTSTVVNRPDPDKFQVIEIARKKIIRLNTPENQCDDGAEPFKECIDEFVEREIGCQLPHTKGTVQ